MKIFHKNYFLLAVCTIQLIATIERQTFDFLGFMWIPILINFINLIFLIYGFFGAFQYRLKYILLYTFWNILWITWNIFLICFYLNVGILDKDSDLLNFGTGSFSWWQINGPGCKAIYLTEPEFIRPSRPTNVTGCVIDYEVVEVLHSSIQCILAVLAVIGGFCLIQFLRLKGHDNEINTRNSIPQTLYKIEYSQPEIMIQEDGVSPKPMTPRRVKRRSVISRDGTRRSSRNNFVRHSKRRSGNFKTDQDDLQRYSMTLSSQNVNTISQEMLNHNRLSNNWDRPINMSWQTDSINPSTFDNTSSINNTNNTTDQTVEYQNVSIHNLAGSWQMNNANTFLRHGETNPSFDVSNEDNLENCNYRPASVRSSYSNYHGVRATPQVPVRTDILRQSQKQFMLNGGPPAYQDTVI